MHRGVHFSDLVKTSHAECLFQVVEGSLSLSILLVEEVVQDVFVTLDEALRVLLAML